MYKENDIVVSLHYLYSSRDVGDIIKLLNKTTDKILWYKSNDSKVVNSSNLLSWRKATEQEIIAYNQGIRNIKDIKLTYEIY